MTKAEILDKLYRTERVSKRVNKELVDDLKQQAFLILLGKSEEFILDYWERGTLEFYLAKLMYNQANWPKSEFNKIVKQIGITSDIPEEEEEEYNKEEKEQRLEATVSTLYPYHQKLLRLYAELGTYRAVGEYTGVNWKSVYNAVQIAKREVKKKL